MDGLLSSRELSELQRLHTVEADMEIAHRVCINDPEAVNYFVKVFPLPFLDYIGREILQRSPTFQNGSLRYYPSLLSEYYLFIAADFINSIPQWHKVSLFKGLKNRGNHNSSLYSYISTITVRHFCKLRKKEKKEAGMTENEDIATLQKYNGFEELEMSEIEDNPDLKWAWNQLPLRDKLILRYRVIEDRKSLDVFNLMLPYMSMKKDPSGMTEKQRQTAVSLLKNRAQDHLLKLVKNYRQTHLL